MIYGLKVILERFAADRDAVFDDLSRFAKGERIPFYGV
jgi:hypothetical protein